MSGTLYLAVPARWGATSGSRRSLAAWLREQQWPADDIDDALLAVNEAVSNSIEHGYRVERADQTHPGPISITAVIEPAGDQRCARFEIRDQGVWRTDRHDPGGIRSRGLIMMRAVMHEVHVDTGAGGTTVRMTTHPCPNPPPPTPPATARP